MRMPPRPREPRPQDWKFTINQPYDDPQAEEGQAAYDRRRQVRQIQQRQSWREYFGSWLSSIWMTCRWALSLGGTIAPTGAEQQDFDCGEAVANDDRLLASFELGRDQQFFQTVLHSRMKKLPMLMLVVGNPDDQAQIDMIIRSFCEANDLTRQLLAQKFTFFVVSQDQLESKLLNSTDWFRVHPHDDIALFVLFVKIKGEISVMHRIRQPDIADPNRLPAALQEYSSLFEIMAEEDPGYRQV
jgi:hypothetical protein